MLRPSRHDGADCTCGDRDCFVCGLRSARLNAVRMIPLDVLPSGPARDALEILAAAPSVELHVLPPQPLGGSRDAHSRDGWRVWLGAVAHTRQDGDGAVPLRVWAVGWQYFVAGTDLAGYVAGLLGLEELGEH